MSISYVPHLRLAFGGTIGTPAVEEWSNSIRFSTGGGVPEEGNLQGALEACGPVLSTWFSSSGAMIANISQLRFAKLTWILANGKQRGVNTPRIDLLTSGGLGSSSGDATPNPHWYQTQALTLRTDLNRGRGHSGRIYPPTTGALPAGASPYISAAAATGMSSTFSQCLDALSTALGTNLGGGPGVLFSVGPVVASAGETEGPKAKDPFLVPITGVVVDRVGDVQHRRNRQVPRLEGPRAPVTPYAV